MDAQDWTEPEWQAEVRQRLERYRERRRRRGGAEQQQLEFQTPRPANRARQRHPDNVIPFQKTPAPPLADPIDPAVPEPMLDPCTTLFPVVDPASTANFDAPVKLPLPQPLEIESRAPLPIATAATLISERPPQAAGEGYPPKVLDCVEIPERAPKPEPLADIVQPDSFEPARLPLHSYVLPAMEIAVRPQLPATAPARVLPRPAAPVRLRLLAALLDFAAIAGLTALFGLAAGITLGFPHPHRASDWAMLMPFPALWAMLYFLLSYYLCGATPGMRHLRLRVLDFEGHPCRPSHLRLRAWVSLLSLAALGVGFIWAYVDDEGLSWHDHLSQSFIVRA